MAGFKLDRVTEDVHRELTDILRSLKDPRITGLISIVRVELSNDLSHCKVFVSSMDGMEGAKQAVKGLNSAAGFVRREINQRLKMRRTPEFKFVADNSMEHSADIARMLNEIKEREHHED